MKRTLSSQFRISLFSAALLILGCSLFALIMILSAKENEPAISPLGQKNPLDNAVDGVSLLLKSTAADDKYFAANFFPTKNGAKGDGKTDDTPFIQDSLEKAGIAGGTVYLPLGVYRIREPLTVPAGVTLRGDFTSPDSKSQEGIKTILVVEDNPNTGEAPFLTLEDGASLEGITIYYESQSPRNIIEYPASIYCKASASLQNIAIINPYRGICVTGKNTVEIRSVWMSPLDYGILITENDSSVTAEDCYISPTYWLNTSPQLFSDGSYNILTEYLHEHMHGIILEKTHDTTLNRISIEDAAVGMLFNVPKESDSVLLSSQIEISSSDRPIYLESLPKAGALFADSTFRPDNGAGANTVEIKETVLSPVLFSACTFGGLPKTVIKANNNSFLSFYHCNFGTWWDVCFDMKADTFMALSPTFRTSAKKATLGNSAFGLLYNADAIENSAQLLFSVTAQDAEITQSISIESLKDATRPSASVPVFNALDFGVSADVKDNSAALNAALDAAKKEKGIVFLPQGTYYFTSAVTIPESVRLMGVGNEGLYKTSLLFNLDNRENQALVQLEEMAGVEDLLICQASGGTDAVNSYGIFSSHPNIILRNVSVTAARGIWLYDTEDATLEHVKLTVSKIGLHLQQVSDVVLRNVTIADSSGSYTATGLKMESASAVLSGLQAQELACAADLSGETTLNGTLITLRNTTIGIRCKENGKAQLTSVGGSGAGRDQTFLFFQNEGSEALTVQGMIATGEAKMGHLASASSGSITLQGALITSDVATTLVSEGKSQISVYGSVWDTTPTFHARAVEGTIELHANLLRSGKTFEGTEGNYLITEETDGTVTDGVNIIQYIYVPSEGESVESGSGAQTNDTKE